MSDIARAWQSALHALNEARDLWTAGGDAGQVRELLRHARDMTDVIDAELLEEPVKRGDSDAIRMAAAALRTRVQVAMDSLAPLH